jgi:hypothetical protein
MYIDFAGGEMAVYVEDQSAFRSKHTGSELRRFKLGLVVQSQDAHSMILKEIKRAEREGILSRDEEGNVTGRWEVVDSSFCLVGDDLSIEYCHLIQLDEGEDLRIEKLILADMALFPYSYREEFDCDELCIWARVQVSGEEERKLRELLKLGGCFSVVRQGISEEPREMRFGRNMNWSRHGESAKYELVLIDKGPGKLDLSPSDPASSQMARVLSQAASQAEVMDGLLNSLVARGILSNDDLRDLRQKADDRAFEREMLFFEVDDLDRLERPEQRMAWD